MESNPSYLPLPQLHLKHRALLVLGRVVAELSKSRPGAHHRGGLQGLPSSRGARGLLPSNTTGRSSRSSRAQPARSRREDPLGALPAAPAPPTCSPHPPLTAPHNAGAVPMLLDGCVAPLGVRYEVPCLPSVCCACAGLTLCSACMVWIRQIRQLREIR